ncbi:FmdB family zinc ribbon protein [Chloroflexota bacterium]
MPTYEYECPRCAFRFELRRSFSENSPVSCTQCGCDARRIFSPVPIIFKGTGFYSTDHRSNHSHAAPTNGKDEVKTAKTEETKTDSIEEKS